MKLNITAIFAAIVCFFFCLIIQDYFLSTSIGLAFTLFIAIDFINKLGKVFPIKEFILLIASLQWIVGAKISYSLGKVHHKYYMYVDEKVYMNYVVPGLLAMAMGLFLIKNKLPILKIKSAFEERKRKTNTSIAYTLIGIGLMAIVLDKFINIGGLAFILYLSSLLLYVGIGYLFFLFPKYKWYLFFLSLGISFITSLGTGMFHNLLLIASFFGFLVIPNHTSFFTKLSLICIGLFFMYMLQIIKKDFREIIWSGKKVNPIEVFYDLIEREFLVEKETEAQPLGIFNQQKEEEKTTDANNRLNQGWIISKVLDNVPSKQPFLEGRTIRAAIEASLLPRFLAPNKAGADQALINFKEITGLGLSKNASMGLSIIAEFYANYGIVGGWIAMFLYGLLLSLSITIIFQFFGKNSYLVVLWLLFFFFQVVKAETDFIKIFNHLVKSMVFFVLIKYSLTFINIHLFNNNPKNKTLTTSSED